MILIRSYIRENNKDYKKLEKEFDLGVTNTFSKKKFFALLRNPIAAGILEQMVAKN